MNNALRRYQARLRADIAQSLSDTAREAARLACQTAPVRTGALRDSIACDDAAWEGDTAAAAVTASAPYALFVELGTSRARPQPFLRPAARQAAERMKIRIR